MMYDEIKTDKHSASERFIGCVGAIASLLFGAIEAIVIALAITVILYLFLLTPHEVVGSSMMPTYVNGDFLLANKIVYQFNNPKRGEVVIFQYSETEDFIKRIIGEPGDSVTLKDGKFYINGNQLNEESYLDSTVYTSGENYLHEGDTIIVPQGQYFVAGDNRPHSADSRQFGTIEKDKIKGRVWVRYFPFQNFKVIETAKYPNL